jgi:hypothetical protein
LKLLDDHSSYPNQLAAPRVQLNSMPAAHDYRYDQRLPPSPPPSPPSTRRRHKKKPDPFEKLATTPIPSLPSSPANEPNDDQESLLTRVSQLDPQNQPQNTNKSSQDYPDTRTFYFLPPLPLPRQLPQSRPSNRSPLTRLFPPHLPRSLPLARSRTLPRPRRFNMGSKRNHRTRRAS